MVNITEAAAKRIQALRAQNMAPPLGLRLSVRGGGCSGLTMAFSWAIEEQPGDKVIEQDGAKLLVDSKSYLYVKGSTLDYVDTLAASGFKILNPAVKSQCGCGESFSV